MNSCFDESIFTDGSILKEYTKISVNNKADAYLVERLFKQPTAPCDEETYISINSIKPCKGLNIYTINPTNQYKVKTLHFNEIRVVEIAGTDVLSFNEPVPNRVYDYNHELSILESLIMLKFYSTFSHIQITHKLYNYIFPELSNSNLKVINTPVGIRYSNTKILLDDSFNLVDLPNLTLSSPAIKFNYY